MKIRKIGAQIFEIREENAQIADIHHAVAVQIELRICKRRDRERLLIRKIALGLLYVI